MIINTFKKYFATISLFVLPLILANQYYIDDMGRASIGYTKWGVDGRPVADMVMSALNLSSRMVDLAPLPLIISAALMALALTMYRREFIGDNKWGFIVPLAFLANPAIISVFSYRFDVLTFTFAIATAIFLFTLKVRRNIHDIVIGSVFVVIVMSTYQALINLIAILIICEIVKNIHHLETPKDIIKKTLMRVLQVLIGGFIYSKIILPSTFSGGHSTNHPGLSTDIISTMKQNADSYFRFASENFYRSNGEVILYLCAFSCLALTSYLAFKYMRAYEGDRNSWVVGVGAIVSSIFSIPMTMGALLLLEKPLGGVHLYMSASGFFLLLATLLYYCSVGFKKISLIICLPLLYTFAMMYAYGNALQSQERINGSVIADIQQATNSNELEIKNVVFNGAAPRSDVANNASINYPLLKFTVIDYFWNWYWGSAYLSINGVQQDYMASSKSKPFIVNRCNFKKVFEGRYFYAFYSENVLIVDFAKTNCHN